MIGAKSMVIQIDYNNGNCNASLHVFITFYETKSSCQKHNLKARFINT